MNFCKIHMIFINSHEFARFRIIFMFFFKIMIFNIKSVMVNTQLVRDLWSFGEVSVSFGEFRWGVSVQPEVSVKFR